MKILALLGSPRKGGHSETVSRAFCAQTAALGHEVRIVRLNNLEYKGCQGCYACKRGHERCVMKDELAPVLDAVYTADVLLLASPVYYGDVTAQMKGFIDRTHSYFKPDFMLRPENSCRLPSGKGLVFILTQGDPAPASYGDIWPRYDYFFQYYGFNRRRLLRVCGVQASDRYTPPTHLQRAQLLAREMTEPMSVG